MIPTLEKKTPEKNPDFRARTWHDISKLPSMMRVVAWMVPIEKAGKMEDSLVVREVLVWKGEGKIF